MTTDITELAQSLKAAAEKATPGQWMRSSVQFNSITDIANPMEQGNKPHIANTSEKRDALFIAMANPANVLALVEALEKAQLSIAELEREQEHLRPVGVMSEKAFHRLENSECRFIALWPRPGIFLPRKRPEDGVIVYARTAAPQG
ncbi:ead/Ea22-like family protein [Klebsiella variicola]|uniref:ead/Ea22-like family protein n=1 Tax=Klebsiella variicola TaxID=244366 RepID=UPI000E201970|nr:ead/Ea22-like family protein [Klebsiella variicola]